MPRLRDRAALVLGVRRFWGPVQCSGAPRPPRFRCPQAPSASVSALALGLLLLVPAGGRAEDLLVEAVEADAAIEERVRAVLVHRLAGDSAALAADVDDLAERDRVRHDAGLPPTGLTDDVRYLAAGLAVTRDTRRDALADVLAHHPDPVVRRLAEHERDADDAAAADRLLADDRHNRRAAVLNDAVRPLGIFSGGALLAALNPFLLAGSAADSVVTTAINLWHYDRLSTREREALARYSTLLEREPDTRDAPEIARAIRRIGTKRSAALCDDTLQLATRALDTDDLDHAAFYARAAGQIEGCEERAAKPIARVDEARTRRAARDDAALWPVDDPPQPSSEAEARDYEAILVATASGDAGAMVQAASRFRERHDDSDLAPAALYAIAAGRDLGGHRDAAREALEELANQRDTGAGRHAAAVLASADFSPLDAIGDAERRHSRDRARYVLLGGRLDGRTALYTATQFGAEGLHAAQSFGIFNVIGLATRAWQAWRNDPASNQTIIDRGEAFLARDPNSPDAPDVHRRLADAYERAGMYDRALMHLRALPDPDAARIAKLEGKLADRLLTDAEKNGGNPVLLAGIVRHFGDTRAADKARKRLRDRPADDETVLGRDVLETYPSLLSADALDLDARLLDGDRTNGELADGGITLTPGQMRLTLYNEGGPGQRIETRSLTTEQYDQARAAAQEALYARLLTADRRNPETGRFERYVPFFLQGSIDPSGGFYVYPGVKMRPYRTEEPELYQ